MKTVEKIRFNDEYRVFTDDFVDMSEDLKAVRDGHRAIATIPKHTAKIADGKTHLIYSRNLLIQGDKQDNPFGETMIRCRERTSSSSLRS